MSEANVQNLPAVQAAPTNSEIEALKVRGRAQVAYAREVKSLANMIAGMDWGNGNALVRTEGARLAFAQYCRITRANPQTHVDILGGKPYLNSEYWKDRVSSDPLFYGEVQREISAGSEQRLREMSTSYRDRAEALDPADQGRMNALSKALDLEMEADEIARARALYRPPEWATHVYETVITRFINAAPMELIRKGEIADLSQYMIEVRECNWAGNRPPKKKKSGGTYNADPIGNDEPEKTARTRSFRRCATKAFPAYMQEYQEQIKKAETIMEGEFEILSGPVVHTNGDQAVLASGEPVAAESAGANELPGTIEPAAHVAPTPAPEPAPLWDRDDARKRLFATLRDAGITEEVGRKCWQADNLLPESTADWSRADFERAVESLVGPERDQYREGCSVLNVDPEDFALTEIGNLPEYMSDYVALNTALNAIADASPAGAAR